MDGNSPTERPEAQNPRHHCGNCTLPRGTRDADHAIVHHHHHHYHERSHNQPQPLPRPQPLAPPPFPPPPQQGAHALTTPPRDLPPSYNDVLLRDAATRSSRQQTATPPRDRNDYRRRALFWEPVEELPPSQSIYANQHRNGGRLTSWEDIEVAPACTSRRGRSPTTVFSRRGQVRDSGYIDRSHNFNRSSNYHSNHSNHSNHPNHSPTRISPIRFPVPSFSDNRRETRAIRDRSPTFNPIARSPPSPARSNSSLPPLYPRSSPASSSQASESSHHTNEQASENQGTASDDTARSTASDSTPPLQLRPSDHTPFSEDIRSGIREARKLVRTVFIEELLRIKQGEPFLDLPSAWERFVGRIVASGAIQSELEVKQSWRWAFDEPAVGHFRSLFFLSEEVIRSMISDVD